MKLKTGEFSCQKAILVGNFDNLTSDSNDRPFQDVQIGFLEKKFNLGCGWELQAEFHQQKHHNSSSQNLQSLLWLLSTHCQLKGSFEWFFHKKAKHQQLRYLTSTSDWASIQQTLEGFRRDPRAMSWETEHPSGRWGRRGI